MATKPKVFRLCDLFWVGLALAFTIPTILVHIVTDVLWWKSLGMFGIVVFAWSVWPTILWWRYRWIKTIKFVTRHGLLVIPYQFDVSRVEIENETAHVLDAWHKTDIEQPSVDGTYIIFKTYPFKVKQYSNQFRGLILPSTKTIWVGYKKPLSSTAFGHELGHQILANAGRTGNEQELKSYHVRYETPY